MKVLVYAQQMEVGGTQTNAIDLAQNLRDRHGFEIVLFATPGPMVEVAKKRGLDYVPAPDGLVHPSPARMRALAKVVRRERPDLIHAWDWYQCIDAYACEHLFKGIPMVVTDMMMELTRILPKAPITTFGVPELVDQARAKGWRRAELLLPPIDVESNAPKAVDSEAFREEHQVKEGDLTLVTVSRLDLSMKLESLKRSIAAVRALGKRLPLRLLIVGEGPAKEELERLAAEANAELGRSVITLTGPLLDPRPAYQCADVVVGMGGSALRGMAFGKPVVVVGEKGFSSIFDPETEDLFYRKGFYGCGDGDSSNAKLGANIARLADRPEGLQELGEFSRRFVHKHFALNTVADQLAAYCRTAVAETPRFGARALGGVRIAAILARERRLLSYRFWERVKGVKRPMASFS